MAYAGRRCISHPAGHVAAPAYAAACGGRVDRPSQQYAPGVSSPKLYTPAPPRGYLAALREKIATEVIEDIIDTTEVSFAEMRPSELCLTFGRTDTEAGPHIVRAMSILGRGYEPLARAILAAAHYFHAIFQSVTAERFLHLFRESVLQTEEILEQYEIIKHLIDPIISLRSLSLNSTPSSFQTAEASMPDLIFPDTECTDTLNELLRPLLMIEGKSLISQSSKTRLFDYIRDNLGSLDPLQLYQLLKPPAPKMKTITSEYVAGLPASDQVRLTGYEEKLLVQWYLHLTLEEDKGPSA